MTVYSTYVNVYTLTHIPAPILTHTYSHIGLQKSNQTFRHGTVQMIRTHLLAFFYVPVQDTHKQIHKRCFAEIEPKMAAEHYVDRDVYESELSKVCMYACR
jgi:hypothetical protein